jgi:hypothetical protein
VPQPPDAHPPKPNLTLRVGITGHRPKPHEFPSSSFAFVERKLGKVFAFTDSTLAELKKENSDSKKENSDYSEKPPKVRLVSGLAEGADQMAVAAKPANWDLDAILPFPREIYAADFKESAAGDKADVTSKFEEMFKGATTRVALPNDPRKPEETAADKTEDEYQRRRNAAYARLGEFLLRQIDVLVAVWDGKREEGPGGTAAVVRAAIEADIPVVWISTLEDTISRIVEDIDDEGGPIAPDADALGGPLRDAIRAIIFLTIDTDAGDDSHASDATPDIAGRLKVFLNEEWPRPSRWITYDILRRWAEDKEIRFRIIPETIEKYAERWAPLIADGPDTGPLRDRMADILLPRYRWADALAVDFSHRYRAAYFTCYLMAAAAVFVALFGLFGHDTFPDPESLLAIKALLVATELLLVGTIVHIVRRGRKERWQEKWVEYRALAEMLWDVRFLAFIGEHGRIQRSGNLQPASSSWFLWYLRATIREVGLPNALLDGTYQRAVLDTVNKHVITEQIVWHKKNAKSLRRIYDMLHAVSVICFLFTLGILFVFFVAWLVFTGGMALKHHPIRGIVGLPHDPALLPSPQQVLSRIEKLGRFLIGAKTLVTFATAFLPALGAALAGIRETGDFGRFSERSIKTAASLEATQRDLGLASRKLSLDATGSVLLSTAQVLTEDLAAWQSVYGHKRLDLPT